MSKEGGRLGHHIDVPEGYAVIRIRDAEGIHYDVVVHSKVAQGARELFGPELFTEEGFSVESVDAFARQVREARLEGPVVVVGDSEASQERLQAFLGRGEERIQRMLDDFSVSIEGSEIVPHLKRFEYIDRPVMDCGPVARPRSSSGASHRPTRSSKVDLWRKKSRAARKARRKSRKKRKG